MSEYREIATAPGDLPAGEIVKRLQSVHHQFRHDNTIEPLTPTPGAPVRIEAVAGTAIPLEAATVVYTTDGTLPGPESARVAMRYDGASWTVFGGYVGRWSAELPGQPDNTTVRYRIVGRTRDGRETPAQDGQGFWYRYPAERSVTTFAYRVRSARALPAWLESAVIYQIFVDRFRRRSGAFLNPDQPNTKHGGELLGIVDALPYLEKLGVDCLWLSPIGPAPSYHRYDATDFFSVDPLLGDTDAVRTLTAEAHRRGIRVILDFVPSHLSVRHPAFQKAVAVEGADTHDWFVFYRWPDEYRSFLDSVPSLVSFNTASEGAREFVTSSARHWVECGFDGLRLDHVIGHGMDFWVEFQRALEEVSPDVVTIGEATDTGDALRRYTGRLTSVLDFPLARALRLTFATGDWSLAELENFLELYGQFMADGPHLTSFYDNHDMDRFLHVAGQDRDSLRLATLCLMTLPQTPVLYYGTEIGMTHEEPTSNRRAGGDALARADMVWDESEWDTELLAFFRAIIRFRRDHVEAVRRARRLVHLDPERGTWAYEIGDAERRYLVAFNISAEAHSIDVGIAEVMLATSARSAQRRGTALVVPRRTGAICRVAT